MRHQKIKAEEEMERLRHQKMKAEDDRRIKEAELEESLYRSQIDTDDDFSTQSDDITAPSNKKGDSSRPATSVWPSKQNPFVPTTSTDFRDSTRPTQQTHTRHVDFADAAQARFEHQASQAYVHFSATEVGRSTRSDVAEPRSYESAHTFPMKAHTSVSYGATRARQPTRSEHATADRSYYDTTATTSGPRDQLTSERRSQQSFRDQQPFVGRQGYDPWRGYSNPLIPKPEVKKFDGDPLDYWAFSNRFRCHVADWLPSKAKMSYLLQHCSPEVRDNIQHFADINDGQYAYDLAWDELKRRYGQPYIIAHACEEKLLAFPKLEREVADRLNRLSVLMKKCCYALADDNVASSLDSVGFLTSIASKFPLDLKRKWVDATVEISLASGRLATFKDLALFVEEQTRISNSVFGLKLFAQSSTKVDQSKNVTKSGNLKGTKSSTFNTLTTEKKAAPKKCLHCAEPHYIYQCKRFRLLSYSEKCEVVKKHGLCRICLNTGHFAAKCTSGLRCRKGSCGSLLHNTTLHPPDNVGRKDQDVPSSDADASTIPPSTSSDNTAAITKSLTASCRSKAVAATCRKRSVYLDIVPVKVHRGNVVVHTYALLDSGSDRTFCERRLVTELGSDLPASPVKLIVQTLTDKDPDILESAMITLNISSLDNSFNMSLAEVVVVDDIPVMPTVVPEARSVQMHPHLSGVSVPAVKEGSVTLLIGNDFVEAHRCLESRFSPDPQQSPDAVRLDASWRKTGPLCDRFNNCIEFYCSRNGVAFRHTRPSEFDSETFRI